MAGRGIAFGIGKSGNKSKLSRRSEFTKGLVGPIVRNSAAEIKGQHVAVMVFLLVELELMFSFSVISNGFYPSKASFGSSGKLRRLLLFWA
jgi:hypothetical protein